MRRGGSVIQGSFRHGLPHFAASARAPVQPHPAGARVVPRGVVSQPFPASTRAVPLPAGVVTLGRMPGRPLPPAVRQKMEAVFRTNFSDVRVHVGSEAVALGAQAFTHGANVYFAPGQYEPATARGQQILAHELMHVVQQRSGRAANPYGSGVAVIHDQQMEAEASRMAARAATPLPVQPKMPAARRSSVLQRKPLTCRVDNKAYDVIAQHDHKRHLYLVRLEDRKICAEMRYVFDEEPTALMEHVEAYAMPQGSKAGYLLFYEMAVDCLNHMKLAISIGLGVTLNSTSRNARDATEALRVAHLGGVAGEIETAQKQLEQSQRESAAVHIYQSLGFDARDAEHLSRSYVTTREVFRIATSKYAAAWAPYVPPAAAAPARSFCFLTTACVEARGLPDDCEELTVLRRFRDEYVRNAPGGEALIAHYYSVAPRIVAALDERPDRAAILDQIYGMVRDCIAAIGRGEAQRALL
ncbi:MAG TPA: DUF4157 domain-containing protein, partial [Thermoanaerobaculia bacterium]|nr:DUF4157 domain-containing protein [Thermoanaerobaculia bacterium]